MPSSWTISQISGKVSDFSIFPDLSDPSSSPSEKTFPISHIVNSSRVSSVSDPPMSSDFLLVKWRPVSSGGGSWEDHAIIPGGRLLSWLVSLLNEDIMGFIVEGGDLLISSLVSLLHSEQISIPHPRPIASTSFNALPQVPEDFPVLVLGSQSPTRQSPLEQSATISLGCLTSASTS
jgi:hypothetical protein